MPDLGEIKIGLINQKHQKREEEMGGINLRDENLISSYLIKAGGSNL